MTLFKWMAVVFILAVMVFHILPQIPSGVKRIEARAHNLKQK